MTPFPSMEDCFLQVVGLAEVDLGRDQMRSYSGLAVGLAVGMLLAG